MASYATKENLDFRVAIAGNGEDRFVGFSVAYEVSLESFGFLKPYFAGSGEPKLVYGDELAVAKEYRRKGIGTKLMQSRMARYSSEYSLTEGVDAAFAIGRTDVNSRMVPLYGELGFENTGIFDPQYPSRVYFAKPLVR